LAVADWPGVDETTTNIKLKVNSKLSESGPLRTAT
jgi:hypothetical protein